MQMSFSHGEWTISLSGRIDELADLYLPKLPLDSAIVLDLGNVQMISSAGLRKWAEWVSLLPPVHFRIRNCPSMMVHQINMLPGLIPKNSAFDSFYVPFYSEQTGEDKMVLFEAGKDFERENLTVRKTLEENGNVFEIDVNEKLYFKFLGQTAC
jgi:hypothetical protein